LEHKHIDERETIEASPPVQSETLACNNRVDLPVTVVSKKMLVETQTPSEKIIAAEAHSAGTNGQMDSQILTTVPQKIVNEKAPKQKKSLLSRISSGFRFSFRGNKKSNSKKSLSDGVVHYPIETNNNNNNNNNKKSNSNSKQQQQQQQQQQPSGAKKNDNGEFVYIPLKSNDNVQNINSSNVDKLASELNEKLHNVTEASDRQSRSTMPREKSLSPPKGATGVMGKPPLPKQPPRIVGTTTKRPSAHAPRASSTPRECDDNGEFYHQNMIGDGLKQQYYTDRARTMDSSHKIGLIETNLDTDETIINGKTQSLMELGIGQNSGGNRSALINQMIQNSGGNSANSGANSSEHTGRPHKSMEFLLDKENHQRILVSVIEIFCLNVDKCDYY
jgi:hypothetical protein